MGRRRRRSGAALLEERTNVQPNAPASISEHLRDVGQLLNRFATGLETGAAADVRIELPRARPGTFTVTDRPVEKSSPPQTGPPELFGISLWWILGGAAAILFLASRG